MRVDQFDFELPERLIAQTPVEPRDAARMLYVGDTLADLKVRDLPGLLAPGDLLVFNNSKVIPARLFAELEGKPIEVLLHQRKEEVLWHAFARPARKLKEGMELTFGEGFTAQVEGRTEDGQVILRFTCDDFLENLERYGHMPLPPYISRADNEADRTLYQTIYAKHAGSVAAPTAGLHFTQHLAGTLAAAGMQHTFVTLHVGAGTFQPVKVEDTDQHVMHAEWAEVSPQAASAIHAAKARGSRVVAVGTTSLRILESATDETGLIRPFQGETRIFITPGYRFRLVDKLITNFHLPKSTLFMLVSAFAGFDRMKAAYAHAIANDYRFYSYGDASLLERA